MYLFIKPNNVSPGTILLGIKYKRNNTVFCYMTVATELDRMIHQSLHRLPIILIQLPFYI